MKGILENFTKKWPKLRKEKLDLRCSLKITMAIYYGNRRYKKNERNISITY